MYDDDRYCFDIRTYLVTDRPSDPDLPSPISNYVNQTAGSCCYLRVDSIVPDEREDEQVAREYLEGNQIEEEKHQHEKAEVIS